MTRWLVVTAVLSLFVLRYLLEYNPQNMNKVSVNNLSAVRDYKLKHDQSRNRE
jgi:hypothetical protein